MILENWLSMIQFMKDHFKTVRNMDGENYLWLLVCLVMIFMKVIGNQTKNMVKELNKVVIRFILVPGNLILNMEKENYKNLMVKLMMEIGWEIKRKVLGQKLFLIHKSTLDNIRMINLMVKENIITVMVLSTLDIFRMVNNKVREN